MENSCHLLKINAYCDVVTLGTKHKIYRMWVLQRYLLLLEQYLALCYVLKVTWNVKNPCLKYVGTCSTARCCGNVCSLCQLCRGPLCGGHEKNSYL